MVISQRNQAAPVNRQRAHGASLKIGNAVEERPTRKLYTAAGSGGTHTTLPGCVSGLLRKAQEAAIYAPRQIPRSIGEAQVCSSALYNQSLEPSYFNGLHSRRRLHLRRGGGR